MCSLKSAEWSRPRPPGGLDLQALRKRRMLFKQRSWLIWARRLTALGSIELGATTLASEHSSSPSRNKLANSYSCSCWACKRCATMGGRQPRRCSHRAHSSQSMLLITADDVDILEFACFGSRYDFLFEVKSTIDQWWCCCCCWCLYIIRWAVYLFMQHSWCRSFACLLCLCAIAICFSNSVFLTVYILAIFES